MTSRGKESQPSGYFDQSLINRIPVRTSPDVLITKPEGVQVTDRGKFLVLDPTNSLEMLPDCVWWRNYQFATQIREIVDPDHTVIVPQKPTTTEALSEARFNLSLDGASLYVYGSVLPEKLWKRSTKIQVHRPINQSRVPNWFDMEFPEYISGTTLPGYSVFTSEDMGEAVNKTLEDYESARLKDPNAASGEDQTIIRSAEDLLRFFLDKQNALNGETLEDYLNDHGYIVEPNLRNVDAWSVTTTYTPNGEYTSVGKQLVTEAKIPEDLGRGTMKEYGGTTAVTFRGLPTDISKHIQTSALYVPDPLMEDSLMLDLNEAIIEAAEKHIEGLKLWEKDGISRTRANIDVLTGSLRLKNGDEKSVTASVEDSGRVGGATSEELRSISALQANPDLPYIVHSSRHVFDPDQAAIYLKHTQESGGHVYWHGNDPTWGGKFIMICCF